MDTPDDPDQHLHGIDPASLLARSLKSGKGKPGTGNPRVWVPPAPEALAQLLPLQLTSNNRAGNGALAGLDVSAYDGYAMKFTLVSADGSKVSSPVISVGTAIGPLANSTTFGVKPVLLSLPAQASAESAGGGIGAKTWLVGIHVSLFAGHWSEGPHDVTILVEPVPGAAMIYPSK